MDSVATTKTCTKCGEVKLLTEFGRDSSVKDGRKARCKACISTYMRERRVQSLDAIKERERLYREANREKLRARSRADYYANLDARRKARAAWREANREAKYQQTRNWTLANKERADATAKEWRQNNPERVATYRRRMHAMRRSQSQSECVVTAKDIAKILSMPCAVPGCTDTRITIDHVVPLARGGRHSIGNLQPLCHSHNARKNTKFWFAFLQSIR